MRETSAEPSSQHESPLGFELPQLNPHSAEMSGLPTPDQLRFVAIILFLLLVATRFGVVS